MLDPYPYPPPEKENGVSKSGSLMLRTEFSYEGLNGRIPMVPAIRLQLRNAGDDFCHPVIKQVGGD